MGAPIVVLAIMAAYVVGAVEVIGLLGMSEGWEWAALFGAGVLGVPLTAVVAAIVVDLS